MGKWIQKKEYPGGLIIIEWNIPRKFFKVVGIGMLGTAILLPNLPFLTEYNKQLLYCCSTPLIILSTLILLTGFKKNTK